jgi:hypothetical protein
MLEVAGILIRQGKAYLPTQSKVGTGTFIEVEPVLVADITVEDLLSALDRLSAAGHPPGPAMTREFWQQRNDPVLAATGAKSWKKLAKDSASYSIEWSQGGITLYMSRLDKKGRFEEDTGKTRLFDPDISLEVILEIILEDVVSRQMET